MASGMQWIKAADGTEIWSPRHWDYLGKSMVPHLAELLEFYLRDRVPPGPFLEAILSNDYKTAFSLAPGDACISLHVYLAYLVGWAPAESWGSPDSVKLWLSYRSPADKCECWEGINDREGIHPCIHERFPAGGGPFNNNSEPGLCQCGADGPPWQHKATCVYD